MRGRWPRQEWAVIAKNAGALIDNLTLSLNRAREAEITQEILEVVAGADALTQ